eukprot:5862800-Prymnesium_polylepis.1
MGEIAEASLGLTAVGDCARRVRWLSREAPSSVLVEVLRLGVGGIPRGTDASRTVLQNIAHKCAEPCP